VEITQQDAQMLLPNSVNAKVQELQKSGEVMTQQIPWNPRNWQIPELAMFETQVSTFANRCQEVGDSRVILRGQVIDFSESFEDVFIGSMIFGYGLTGYGPSRVGRIIKENPDLIEKLHRQYAAAADSPEKSWASHTNEDKVKYLGPAFATKFAYFAARKQKVSGIIPLIADINTSWAIWRLAEIPRSVNQKESYLKYVKLAHEWGDELGCKSGVDEIERALFKIGINVRDQIKKSKK
jgi:hypothetical protein